MEILASAATLWWLATSALVALELLSGSFYLLMLALGSAAGALAAHAGAASGLQMTTAAIVGGIAVAACYFLRRRRPGDPSPRADRSVNLDVGETIHVPNWDANGEAVVQYRGARWTAVYRGPAPACAGSFRIAELRGNRLLLEPLDPI